MLRFIPWRVIRARWSLIAILHLPLSAITLWGQSTTITLQGVIMGPERSRLQGGEIEVRNVDSTTFRRTVSGPDGRYAVLGLSPGTYDVMVRAIGYRQQRRDGVELIIGQRAIVDFVLDPGAVELEPIVVSAERVFEIDRSDVSTAVLQEDIEKLPLNSRNVLNVAAVAPGVRTFAVEAGRTAP